MLSILRRGPASIAKPLLSGSSASTYRSLLPAHKLHRIISSPTPCRQPLRTFIATPPCPQQTAEANLLEEEIEADPEQEKYPQKPSSESNHDQEAKKYTGAKFENLRNNNLVCETVVDTLTKSMKLETMTQVQSMTIEESLKGRDILAQARTGTGKTLAFLIPLLQNIINRDPALERRGQGGSSTDIRAIIISPTRELAEQIAMEAKKLTRNTGVIVQTAVGGTSKAMGLRAIKIQGCHILVGTPGRLNDLLTDPMSQVRAPQLSALVFDEADRLLEQGFALEIESIQNALPDRRDVDRQTLMYSATIPKEVMQMVRETMKNDFKIVRTVQEGELHTHERVKQKLVSVGGMENLMPALVELCQRELSKDGGRPFKAIVYFSATAEVALATRILRNLTNPGASTFSKHPLAPAKIIEMHAKLTQEQRTRAAAAFREATSAIMLSSDVTARGMDFPNVTHVLQIGVPPSEEQYVHRLGRTARAGQEGEGWLFFHKLENQDLRSKLKKMSLHPDDSLETANVDMTREAKLSEKAAQILTQVGQASQATPRQMKAAAYRANLGMYSHVQNKQHMVDTMNSRARFGWGMEKPPMLGPTTVNKLNLRHVTGLEIGLEPREDGDDFGNYRRGRSPGGRGPSGGFGGGQRGYGGREPENYQRRNRYDGFGGGGDSYGSGNANGDRPARRYSPGLLPRGDMGEARGRPRY